MAINIPVEYRMGMVDNLSAGVEQARGHVNKLESSLKSAGGMIAGLAAGFAIFKSFEFIGESTEAFHKLHEAEGQLENTLKNTGDRAGLTSEEMIAFAKETSHNIKATTADVVGMENALARFGHLSPEMFKRAAIASTDLAASLQSDGVHEAQVLGRILDSPLKNSRLLRQLQITLSDGEKAHLQQMANVNDMAGEQLYIFELLAERGYGGAAKAAADSDPLFRYHKIMEETKLTIGELATTIVKELEPAMRWFLTAIKDGIGWMKEHWKQIKEITIALGAAWLAFKVIGGARVILLAIENALVSAAVAGGGFGTAMASALGPVGLLAAALGALVLVYREFLDDEAEHEAQVQNLNKSIIAQEQIALDKTVEFLEKRGEAHKAAVEHAKAMELESIKNSADALAIRFNATSDPAERQKIMEQSEMLQQTAKAAGMLTGTTAKKSLAPDQFDTNTPKQAKQAKTAATGNRVVTINVSIKELIGIKDFKTVNVKEGLQKLKEAVTGVMTDAVNDFQIIAGQ